MTHIDLLNRANDIIAGNVGKSDTSPSEHSPPSQLIASATRWKSVACDDAQHFGDVLPVDQPQKRRQDQLQEPSGERLPEPLHDSLQESLQYICSEQASRS